MSDQTQRIMPFLTFPTGPGLDGTAACIDRRRLLWGGAALMAAAGLVPGALAQGEDVRFFQIGTATTGGTYFLIGGLLANAVSNPPGARPCDRGGSCGVPGLIVVAQSTSGAVENVNLLRQRRLESALIQADIGHAALTGTGPFDKTPYPGLRAIANLYTETIHLVVRAGGGLKGPGDLKGKRVALGEQGSGTLVTARAILATYGLSEKSVTPFYLSPAAAGDRLAAGELDAFIIVGGFPLPAVAELARRVPIALLPFDDKRAAALKQRLPFFTDSRIEAGTYEEVPATMSLGVGAQWLVRADMKPKLIRDITAALWNDQTRLLLDAGHPRGKSIRRETALDGLAVPLHPGAEDYYREIGMVKELAAAPQAPDSAGPKSH